MIYLFQINEESQVLTSNHFLDTLVKLSFLKILLLDIGLSLSDSITDIIQATRFPFYSNPIDTSETFILVLSMMKHLEHLKKIP